MIKRNLGSGLLFAALIASMALFGCRKSGPQADACPSLDEGMSCCPPPIEAAVLDDGMNVWFRDSDLEAMSTQTLADYGDVAPGDSEIDYIAFYGAPPQIPHSVEDMLPILGEENTCMDCHAPENADEDTPAIPESHFMKTIMAKGTGSDPQVWKVVGEEKLEEMSGMRWNCTLCHTPQATNVINIGNSFEK